MNLSQEYKRIFSISAIMSLIVLIVLVITHYSMYQTALSQTEARLTETAQSQARFFESVLEYNIEHGKEHGDPAEKIFEISLEQFRKAHAKYKGFGKTGEFTLATRENDQIVFLLRHRHFDLNHPKPVSWGDHLAEPMRRALSGTSGQVIGPDYRGETVVAAYEPLKAPIPLGIVAKIDLVEIQKPFIRTGLWVFVFAVIFVFLGTYLFFRIFRPIVDSLRSSEARFKNLAEMSSVGLYLTGKSGNYLYVNALWLQHTGLKEREALGDGWMKGLHPEDRDRIVQEWNRFVKSGGGWEKDYRLWNAETGQTTWVKSMLRETRDPYNKVYGYVGVNIDITGQKEAEVQAIHEMEKRIEQERLFAQSSKMAEMGEMIGAIIHQWKQPLNVIGILASSISDEVEDTGIENPNFLEIEKEINEKVSFMDQTINDFRKFFNPDTPSQFFSPSESIDKIKTMFRGVYEKQNITINTEVDEDFTIFGRESEFMHVLLNLFNNARDIFVEKKRKDGEIQCLISRRDHTGIIRIRDNAGGIPEELLPEKLFESHVSTKGKNGTGIGLQLSSLIIKEHLRGKLWVHNVDDGAEFVIELPLSDEQA